MSALLAEMEGFHSAQDLHAMLRQRGERVGLTTVYRTLQGLADAGEIDVMRPPGGEHLYRRCSEGHHHHLVCRSCGRTVEVAGPGRGELGRPGRRAARLRRRQPHPGDLRHLPDLPALTTAPAIASGATATACRGTLAGVKIYADRFPTAARQLLTDLLVVAWVYAGDPRRAVAARPGAEARRTRAEAGGRRQRARRQPGRRRRQGRPGPAGRRRADRAVPAGRRRRPGARRRRPRPAAPGRPARPGPRHRGADLPARHRAVRLAAAAGALDAPGRVGAKLAAGPAGRDLLALRALATQPLGKLTRIGPDVAEAWRRGDDATVDALAALELRQLGLRGRGR